MMINLDLEKYFDEDGLNFRVPRLHYTCKGLSDLGNGPNKPTVTIIGEYSASYHDGALIFTLVNRSISESSMIFGAIS